MYLMNMGNFTIGKVHTEHFLKLLVDQNIIDKPENVEITEVNDEASIELSEVYGNLEDPLNNLCKTCRKEGIVVDGLIEYYGDYNGRYEITDNTLHEYSNDEYAVKEALETRDLISPSLKAKLLQMIEKMESMVLESPEKCIEEMQSMKQLLTDSKGESNVN